MAAADAACLAALAEAYLHVADDVGSGASGASLAPDVASATFYATHALALDAHSVGARRVLAACYLLGGAALVFPFAPSSLGDARAAAPGMPGAARASALSAVHLLRHGTPSTFADVGSARVYATACTVLGRFQDAQEALEWTTAHRAPPTQPTHAPAGRDMYASQVSTQLGRIAMKQARYADAAAHFERARAADPLNWGAWTGLCDVAMAPPANEAWPDDVLAPEAPRDAEPAVRMDERDAAAVPADVRRPPTRRARTPPAPPVAKRVRSNPDRPDGAAPAARPLRQVTPRAAALRSGMARTAPSAAKDTHVPPVPPVPSGVHARGEARTLAQSRGANRAAPAAAGDAKPSATTRLRRAVTPTEAARPRRVVAARTDSGLRRKEAPKGRPAASATVAAAPAPTPFPATAPLLALLRDVGEAYRLVRLYRGREAVHRLCGAGDMPRAEVRTAAVHCLVGRALHDLTEYAAAEAQFRAARVLEPYLLMHMDIYSLVLFQLHREVALAALAQDLLAIDPRATAAHIAAGNTWSLQHQHDAAYQCFRQAMLVSPECAYAYTLAGYEALELEQPARAVRLFRSARRCDRRHWNALAGLGQVYLRQGHAVLASEAYAEAFLINSSNAVLLDLLGWALEQTGDVDGALAVYQRAIAMQPKAAMTRLKKAQLLLRTVRDAEAGELLPGAPRLSSRDVAQRQQAAHAELLRVCALAPNEAKVHMLLARSYMRLGGGRFADDGEPRQPHTYAPEIAHHLAAAVDLDPRLERDISALGDGPRLALPGMGAAVAEDDVSDALCSFDEIDGAVLGDPELTDAYAEPGVW